MSQEPGCLLAADAEGADPIEIPIEDDGTVLLSTLRSQFPNAIGLKFRNPTTRAFRAVKLTDSVFYPPNAEMDWGSGLIYLVTNAQNDESNRKRSLSPRRETVEDDNSSTTRPLKKASMSVCRDLIVLNLPYTYTEADLEKHFHKFGELAFTQIKKSNDGRSRGFGFIRFVNYEDQKKVLGQTFILDSRRVEVRKPQSKDDETSARLFVGKLDDIITKSDLIEYFEQYGDLVQVHYDYGKRRYAFIEFDDADNAHNALKDKVHFIKNIQVVVSLADPVDKNKNQRNGGGAVPPPHPNPAEGVAAAVGGRGGAGPPVYNRPPYESATVDYSAVPRYDDRAGGSGRLYVESRGEDIVNSLSKAISHAVSQQLSSQLGGGAVSSGYDSQYGSAPAEGLPPRDDYYYAPNRAAPNATSR